MVVKQKPKRNHFYYMNAFKIILQHFNYPFGKLSLFLKRETQVQRKVLSTVNCVIFVFAVPIFDLSSSRRPLLPWSHDDVCVLSHCSRVRLFATQWTVALQAPLSMGFSRQGNWSGLPCPPPGDLPNRGIKPTCLLSLLHW